MISHLVVIPPGRGHSSQAGSNPHHRSRYRRRPLSGRKLAAARCRTDRDVRRLAHRVARKRQDAVGQGPAQLQGRRRHQGQGTLGLEHVRSRRARLAPRSRDRQAVPARSRRYPPRCRAARRGAGRRAPAGRVDRHPARAASPGCAALHPTRWNLPTRICGCISMSRRSPANPFMRSIGAVIEAALRASFRLSAPTEEKEREITHRRP